MLKSKILAIFVNEIINVIATIVNVDSSNCFDDLLSINGILLVLIMCIINVCESIPNTNHPLWKYRAFSSVLNLNTNQRTAKHKTSSIVLIPQKTKISYPKAKTSSAFFFCRCKKRFY